MSSYITNDKTDNNKNKKNNILPKDECHFKVSPLTEIIQSCTGRLVSIYYMYFMYTIIIMFFVYIYSLKLEHPVRHI